MNKNVWHLTDDDSAQYICYLDPIAGTTGKLFDLIQVTKIPDGYVISKDVIDIGSYSEENIEDILKLYGYEGLDDFVEETSPVKIPKLPDGTLDKESEEYIIDYSLIAEMLFETTAFECLIPGKYDTFDAAAEKVREIILNDGVIA